MAPINSSQSKAARRELGLSQADVATEVGFNRAYLSDFEGGFSTRLTNTQLKKLRAFYEAKIADARHDGVEIELSFGDSDERPTEATIPPHVEQVASHPDDRTFDVVASRYEREVIPKKQPRTQRDNLAELANLRKVFGSVPIDSIRPCDVRTYMDIRSAKAKVRANREKALLSHVFNHAREWGYTNAPNPCAGIKGNKEAGRDRYVGNEELAAVRAKAHYTVQDAIDLALLTGQRPADILKMTRADIRDGALHIRQNKTGKKLAIEIIGELAEVIERITSRPAKGMGLRLIQDESGRALTYWMLRNRFDKAREEAGVSFQFRDIRAKAATDIGDLARAQKLLGHKNRDMTEHYTRDRLGERVKPLR